MERQRYSIHYDNNSRYQYFYVIVILLLLFEFIRIEIAFSKLGVVCSRILNIYDIKTIAADYFMLYVRSFYSAIFNKSRHIY